MDTSSESAPGVTSEEPGTAASEPVTGATSEEPGTAAYMAQVLLAIEADIHGGGWDRTPQLHALVGPGLDAGGWTLEALMADPVFWINHHARNVLRAYADFCTLPDLPPGAAADRDFVINGMAKDGLHAALVVFESWRLEGTVEERGKYARVEEHPDAYEARELVAVAPDSTVYLVKRRRGHEPDVSWVNHATGERGAIGEPLAADLVVVAGGVARSLRRIVNAVNARAGLPLIKHVTDMCNRCGAPMPMAGAVPVPVCPACGKGSP